MRVRCPSEKRVAFRIILLRRILRVTIINASFDLRTFRPVSRTNFREKLFDRARPCYYYPGRASNASFAVDNVRQYSETRILRACVNIRHSDSTVILFFFIVTNRIVMNSIVVLNARHRSEVRFIYTYTRIINYLYKVFFFFRKTPQYI